MTRREAMEMVSNRIDEMIGEVRRICGIEEENISPMTLQELNEIKEALNCIIIDNLLSDDIDTKRKILFRHGMSNDAVIILTDATKQRIEQLCRLEKTQEYGIGHIVECLKVTNQVMEIFDSEIHDIADLDYLEWDETYDLSAYRESRFKIISMERVAIHPNAMLEAVVDLNGKGDNVYFYLGIESIEEEDLRAYGKPLEDTYDAEVYALEIARILTAKEKTELYGQMKKAYMKNVVEW